MFIRKVLFASLVTQFWFVIVYAQYRYDCYENFCSEKVPSCPELNCKKDSRLIRNATKCGCCHICIEQLEEGAACKTQEFTAYPRQECGPGLKCMKRDKAEPVCVPADTECIKDRIQYDRDNQRRFLSSDKSRPECDEFGFYKAVVCVSDVLCYCVNKQGERIFGTDVARNKDAMNCNCSRDFDSFPRSVPTGDFLRCMRDGSYDPLQCTEKWCYCLRDSLPIVRTKVKADTTLKDLLCYDKQRHGDDDAMLRSKCWRERNSLLNEMKEYENKKITVVGVDLPQCDLDGSYAPVQCRKDSCYCVKRNGKLYAGSRYEARRGSTDAKDMNCRCIREKEMLSDLQDEEKVKNFFKKYPCDEKGNYKQEY